MNQKLLFFCLNFVVGLTLIVPANAQNQSLVDFLHGQDEFVLARDAARLWYESDPTNSDAMQAYIELAMKTGYSKNVVRLAENFAILYPSATRQSLYCKVLWQAGELGRARNLANQILNNRNSWRFGQLYFRNQPDVESRVLRRIEPALDRLIELRLRIDPQNTWYNVMVNSQGYIRVPIPMDKLAYQNSTYVVKDANDHYEGYIGDERFVYVRADGINPFQVICLVSIEAEDLSSLARLASGNFPVSYEQYLRPTVTVDWKNSAILSVAKQLKKKTAFETVEATLSYCSEHIRYLGTDRKASDVLRSRGSHCEGRSTLAIALLRANGIPSRLIRGHSRVRGDFGTVSHHTIVEYYLDTVGWIPWDFQQAAGVVSPRGFVALWRYPNRVQSPEPNGPTKPLWNFHGLDQNRNGLPRFGTFTMLLRK